MRHELEKIRELCKKHLTESKLLIIPGSGVREQLRKTLCDNGISLLNVQIKTVSELVYDIASQSIIDNGEMILDSKDITDATTEVLKRLRAEKTLVFLNEIEITSGVSRALSKTVLELLGWGYLHGETNLDGIINKNKRNDLELIVNTYTKWKKDNKSLDYPDVTERAISVIEKSNSLYTDSYVLEACEFNSLEIKLLKKLGITVEKVTNDAVPGSPDMQTKSIKFFSAYGEYNEAKEVLRRIFEEKVPFDSVLIATTKNEPYSQLFFQLLQQYLFNNEAPENQHELPITFGNGLPLLMSSPAKLLMLLLDWIASGYNGREFIRLFTSGVFEINTDTTGLSLSKLSILNAIKKSGLKYQRRTYIPCFEKYTASLEKKNENNSVKMPPTSGSPISDLVETPNITAMHGIGHRNSCLSEESKPLSAAKWLVSFIKNVFDKIPDTDAEERVDIGKLCDGLKSIVNTHKIISSKFDNIGLQIVLRELSPAVINRKMKLSEAVILLKERMTGVNIKREAPAPGKIHIATYKQAIWINRANVFLPGLGSDSFPGVATEDPFIADNERMGQMVTSAQRINKNIEIMNSFLQSINNNLTCSFSSYDTIENRENFASTLFHRLNEKTTEEVKHVNFVLDDEDRFLDFNDYWLHKGVLYGAVVPDDRENASGISFDNPVKPGDNKRKLVFSATSLRDYLSCKYKFFMKRILRLDEIDEFDIDTTSWLSAADLGTLYHEIFEHFMLDAEKEPSILNSKESAVKYISKLTEEKIAEYDDFPSASEFYTDLQKNDLRENAKRFAENEVDAASDYRLIKVEREFGKGDESLKIDLDDGIELRVSGAVDRINFFKNGKVEVFDYKSGSTYSFEGLKPPDIDGITEKNIQLTLYYLAMLEIANTSEDSDDKQLKNVDRLYYSFITARGNYDEIEMVPCDNAEKVYKDALRVLIADIAKGVFLPEKGTDGSDPDCKFCGYKKVCPFVTEKVEF